MPLVAGGGSAGDFDGAPASLGDGTLASSASLGVRGSPPQKRFQNQCVSHSSPISSSGTPFVSELAQRSSPSA